MRLPFILWSISGVPSSQALPGYLITAPPSLCVSDALGTLACGFQTKKKRRKVGVSFQTTPMGTITYIQSSRTGFDSSRHTHGSESSLIVQGLLQDLNVYKPHGVWFSQWNLTTTDAFKMQWVCSFFTTTNKQISTVAWVLHTRVYFFPDHNIKGLLFPNQKRLGPFPKKAHTPSESGTGPSASSHMDTS